MTIRVPRNHVASPSFGPTTNGLVSPRVASCMAFSSSTQVEYPSPPESSQGGRSAPSRQCGDLWADCGLRKRALASPIKVLLLEHLVVEAPNDSDILYLGHESAPSSGKPPGFARP